MVVAWPVRIKHDEKPREAFLHLVDVMPTILEAPHISMPKTVNGIVQKPLAGNSFRYAPREDCVQLSLAGSHHTRDRAQSPVMPSLILDCPPAVRPFR
jgi:arylsulfatase A-like enzyme